MWATDSETKCSSLEWRTCIVFIATALVIVGNGAGTYVPASSLPVEEYADLSLHSHDHHCGSHAVVLSGLIASFERNYAVFKARILDTSKEAHADVYAHVYSNATSPEHRKAVHLLSSNPNVKSLVVETWSRQVVDSIKRYLGNTTWTCYREATAKAWEVPGGRDPADYAMRVLSNFRKMYLANQMQRKFRTEHGCNYSYVLRLRLDLVHGSDLRVPPRLEPGTVHVPDATYFRTNVSEPLNDQMVLGTPEDMDSLLNFYPKIPSLCREIGIPYPEILMRKSQNVASLQAVYLDHQYELDSVREQLDAVVDPVVSPTAVVSDNPVEESPAVAGSLTTSGPAVVRPPPAAGARSSRPEDKRRTPVNKMLRALTVIKRNHRQNLRRLKIRNKANADGPTRAD